MLYWTHRFTSWLLTVLPVQVAYGLVYLFAPLVSRFWKRQYQSARLNARLVLGPWASEAEIERMVRQTFRNYGKYLVDTLRLPRISMRDVERRMRFEGMEHIEQGLQLGRGLIIATAHIGNWDLAGALLTHRGYPVNVVVETLHPPEWNHLVQQIRAKIGMRALPLEHGVRQMLHALRSNEILGVLVDRPLAEQGVSIRLFGAETRVPAGSATLAIRTGAQVVAAVVVRDGNRFAALVSPLLASDLEGDLATRVRELTQRIFSWHESVVREYPDQWYMFRDMWPRQAGSA